MTYVKSILHCLYNILKHRYSDSFEDTLNIGQLISEGNLTNEETLFLKRVKEAWNFYEGYHWEGMDDLDSLQITYNYCRPFVNKFVSFEFGRGFAIHTPIEIENIGVTVNDPKLKVDLDDDGDGTVTEEEIRKNYEWHCLLGCFLQRKST